MSYPRTVHNVPGQGSNQDVESTPIRKSKLHVETSVVNKILVFIIAAVILVLRDHTHFGQHQESWSLGRYFCITPEVHDSQTSHQSAYVQSHI